MLAAPFVLPPATVAALAPRCQWKEKYGRECALCGMTTSFLLISKGRLNDALRHNRAGIPLYAALVWNECLAAGYALSALAGKRQPRLAPAEELSCRW